MSSAKSYGTAEKILVLGSISGVFGIRGWVKVYSYTQPIENILNYSTWRLKIKGTEKTVKIATGRRQGQGLVAQIEGVYDRNLALDYVGANILMPADKLEPLKPNEYYWHQLEGLEVLTQDATKPKSLGKVDHLIATGANDVFVVKPTTQSIDNKERLIPYLDQHIVTIDLQNQQILVDWDTEF